MSFTPGTSWVYNAKEDTKSYTATCPAGKYVLSVGYNLPIGNAGIIEAAPTSNTKGTVVFGWDGHGNVEQSQDSVTLVCVTNE